MKDSNGQPSSNRRSIPLSEFKRIPLSPLPKPTHSPTSSFAAAAGGHADRYVPGRYCRPMLPLPPFKQSRVAPVQDGHAWPNKVSQESIDSSALSSASTPLRVLQMINRPAPPQHIGTDTTVAQRQMAESQVSLAWCLSETPEDATSNTIKDPLFSESEHQSPFQHLEKSQSSWKATQRTESQRSFTRRRSSITRTSSVRSFAGDAVWPDPSRYNAVTELGMTLSNPIRKAAIRSIEWKWWDRGVLFLIFLNTLQLALYNPIVRGNRFL